MVEIYQLPQGKIIIGISTANISLGLLYLLPHQEYPKHNRPVSEQLTQIQGNCVMKLFEGDKVIKEVTLHENDSLVIPANQYHMHTNPFDTPSLTLWKFEGDITEIITKIRNENKRLL